MQVFLGLLLLTFMATVMAQQRKQCKPVFYDYYTLALTWPNQFCSENTCVKNWKNSWDGKSFTIHGFWPSSTDLSYLFCKRDNLYDEFCYRPYKFSQNQFSKSQVNDLNTYWPKLGMMDDFWGYEWSKHGTCYLSIIKDEYHSSMLDADIFKKYFMNTINLVKSLNLSLKQGKIQTKIVLGNALKIHPTQFYAICGNDNQLDEIRICYEVVQVPGTETIMSCPKSTDRNQCKFPIVIN